MTPVELPVHYDESISMMAGFLVRTPLLAAKTPPGLKVVEVFPGWAPLGMACLDYRRTSLGPYGEVGISWPTVVEGSPLSFVPLLPLLAGARWPGLGWWVHELPVSTEVAVETGRRFWAYPKWKADIAFEWRGPDITCSLKEGGEQVLSLTIDTRMPARPQTFTETTFSRRGEELLATRIAFEATGWQRSLGGGCRLILGRHRVAEELRSFGLETARPVAVRWFPVWRAVLPAAEHVPVPWRGAAR